jgi:hypothetical protein
MLAQIQSKINFVNLNYYFQKFYITSTVQVPQDEKHSS